MGALLAKREVTKKYNVHSRMDSSSCVLLPQFRSVDVVILGGRTPVCSGEESVALILEPGCRHLEGIITYRGVSSFPLSAVAEA